MTVRIPSSLKWLINRHARLLSEMTKTEKELASQHELHRQLLRDNKRAEATSATNLQARKTYLQQLKSDLQIIDSTLLLHDIPINPEIIAPINTQTAPRYLRHGEMTRLIFSCLKYAKGEYRTTSEIFAFIITHCSKKLPQEEQRLIRHSVQKRLVELRTKGRIAIVPQAKSNYEGRWQLANWPSLSPIGRPRKSSHHQ